MALYAYKQFNRRDGKLYPLFVDTKKEIPIGVWLIAEPGERTENGKVKSKLGPLAYRPGWHLSEAPYAPHIGEKEGGTIKYMHKDTVWALCAVEDKHDYTALARRRGMKKGKFIARDAFLNDIPIDGYYWYNTNPNAFGNWMIAHKIKVLKVLTDNEVEEICMSDFGIHALPHRA